MRKTALALALALAALPACKTVQTGVDKAETSAAKLLLPVEDERKLGTKMQTEIEAKSKLSTNAAVVDYVKAVGARVATATPNPERWRFTFKVIDDPKTVNAFAIPGGTIYVYTGLLKAARDEAELAGVLAHEVAHVTQRHIAKRMVAQMGLQTVLDLALGEKPGQVEAIAGQLLVGGALLKNSRDDEAEADAEGVVATARAKYDPNALASFFETLKKQEGSMPGALAFLSDHPATTDRIREINEIIRTRQLPIGERNEAAFAAIKAGL